MKKSSFALCFAIFIIANKAFGSSGGMPQLNTEFWSAQIFWLVVIFSGLYLVIWRIFLPKITHSIENRKSKLVNDLNEAQKLKEDAEKKLNLYNKIIEDSKKDAKKIVDDSNKKLVKDIENKKQQYVNEIEKELKLAENEIKTLKKSSVSNINKISSEITSEIIKQLIGNEINKSNVSAIVEDITKKKMVKII